MPHAKTRMHHARGIACHHVLMQSRKTFQSHASPVAVFGEAIQFWKRPSTHQQYPRVAHHGDKDRRKKAYAAAQAAAQADSAQADSAHVSIGRFGTSAPQRDPCTYQTPLVCNGSNKTQESSTTDPCAHRRIFTLSILRPPENGPTVSNQTRWPGLVVLVLVAASLARL